MLRKLVPILALTGLLAAGCGSDFERASAQSDAQTLLRETAGATPEVRSATVDFKASNEGETASLEGAFEVEEEGRLPKFSFTGTHRGETAGATWTGEQGYVTLDGTSYEVSGLLTGQIEAGFEEAFKRRALMPDVSRWLSNPRNEGLADVGGEETVKITGQADVPRVMDDIDQLLKSGKSLNLAVDPLSPEDRQQAIDDIEKLDVTVYTGAADRILRRVVVNAVVDNEGAATFDLTLTRVGEDQDIEAPDDARPFSELLKRTR
jgi:hypothetical protein